jgi:hypothetical protein
MAKGKNRKNRDDTSSVCSSKKKDRASISTKKNSKDLRWMEQTLRATATDNRRRSIYQWCLKERQGFAWVLGCVIFGCLFGFGVGSGWVVGEYGKPPSMWRINLGGKIRASSPYKRFILPWTSTFSDTYGDSFAIEDSIKYFLGNFFLFGKLISSSHSYPPGSVSVRPVDREILRRDPSHPYVYAVLREAIVREEGGYVHPDLGILQPAPCGAARGIGMVRDLYHKCQTRCIPGLANEKLQAKRELAAACKETATTEEEEEEEAKCDNDQPPDEEKRYMQEEVLIKVPLSYQMTRKVALETLLPLIPAEVTRKANLHELDDAALLVLTLAHERGVGESSRWLPYIASLPTEPSCGYSHTLRPHLLDAINALRDEIGMDVNGWPSEILKATQYAERISRGLAKDYGAYLQHPKGVTAEENIAWALCQVASRATGGSQKYGALRMIPLLDMINHDTNAGGFVELTGKERLDEGDFIDAIAGEDEGAFVVRSQRHGRRKALRPGQELLVNYNVPHYSALDWFVSLGFVPIERYEKWQKLDAPLPRIRRDGPFAGIHEPNGGNVGGRRVFPGMGSDN